MAEPNDSKEGGKPKPIFAPFSPFPYGSPLAQGTLQSSFTGSPGQKLLLGSLNHTRTNGEIITPRLKGQDLYGGLVMFGGAGSSARRSRLQSSSPYSAALRTRNADRRSRQGPLTFPPALGVQSSSLPPSSLPSTAPSSPHSSPGPTSTSPAPLSSTAKLILSTLDRLSTGGTPITDAKKIPLSMTSTTPNRAEKRKLLETELNCSLSSPSRRRARLGGGGLALSLAGPPLRKNYSPSLGGPTVPRPSSAVQRPGSAAGNSTPPPPRLSAAPPPTIPADPAPRLGGTDFSNKAKSSFKVKTKVSDSVRKKVDMTSSEAPPSPPCFPAGLPQLKVDQMPVFNLTSTPATKPPITTSNGFCSTTPTVPEPIERNNNKSPQKRQLEETKQSDSSKKQRASALGFSSSASSPATNPPPPSSANKGSKSTVDVKHPATIIKPPVNTPHPKFSFSAPTSVIENADSVTEASKSFTFSPPKTVKTSSEPVQGMTNGPVKPGVTTCSSVNFRVGGGSVNSTTSLSSNFKFNNLNSMPDVTNNLLKKSPLKDKLKGSNSSSRLPDLTASTGFGGFVPAKELKTGSVMDILGKVFIHILQPNKCLKLLGFQNSGF